MNDPASLDYAIAAHANIGCVPGIARAVDDVAVADEEIVGGCGRVVEIGVVRGSGNFSESLPRDGLRLFHVGRESDVIDVSSKGELFAVFSDDVANQAFAVEHQFGIELVFGAESAGFCKHVTGAGRASLNFRERAVFAEDGQRFEENFVVRARGPIREVMDHEIRAEEIGPVSARTIALPRAGKIEFCGL